jgi:hypothetical protein
MLPARWCGKEALLLSEKQKKARQIFSAAFFLF